MNKYQLKRLEHSVKNRGKRLSLFSLLLSAWKFYVVFFCLTGLAIYYFWSLGEQNYSYLMFGFIFGVLWRDLTYARLNQINWPANEQVTDWDKVQEILRANQKT